jgi:diaminopimelate epimerase
MQIKFTKMQALGNDYIYTDCFRQDLTKVNLPDLSRQICDRHFGVGSDGLILVAPGKTHKFRMIFYNPDGSEAEMCGNGIRCFARFLYDQGLSKSRIQDIETKAGIIHTEILQTGNTFLICTDIGKPILERKKIPMKGKGESCVNESLNLDGRKVAITSLSLGNPHTLIFVKEFEPDWREIGRKVENHPMFPRRTNVEFVKVLNKRRIQLKIWERGVGETLASGTGASAAVVAGILNHQLDRKVTAIFDKGELAIEWKKENDHLYITGPAISVFSGLYSFR